MNILQYPCADNAVSRYHAKKTPGERFGDLKIIQGIERAASRGAQWACLPFSLVSFVSFFGVCRDVVNVVEDLIARWRIPLNLYVRRAHCGARPFHKIRHVPVYYDSISGKRRVLLAAATKDAAPRADESGKSAARFSPYVRRYVTK